LFGYAGKPGKRLKRKEQEMIHNNGQMPDHLNRAQVIMVLGNIREEWEEAANGKNPIELKGSVGLLLNDVVNAIGLEPDEKASILGTRISDMLMEIC
jgi:hypothetical protein